MDSQQNRAHREVTLPCNYGPIFPVSNEQAEILYYVSKRSLFISWKLNNRVQKKKKSSTQLNGKEYICFVTGNVLSKSKKNVRKGRSEGKQAGGMKSPALGWIMSRVKWGCSRITRVPTLSCLRNQWSQEPFRVPPLRHCHATMKSLVEDALGRKPNDNVYFSLES